MASANSTFFGSGVNQELKNQKNNSVKLLIKKGAKVNYARALVLGITFKENCPDIRNSKVIDIIDELKEFGINSHVYDPMADKQEVKHEYGIDMIEKPEGKYEAIILAVSHKEFELIDFQEYSNSTTVLYDVKSILDKNLIDGRL